MQHPYSRSLVERDLIEAFLKNALGDERYSDYGFVGKIRMCELDLLNYEKDSPTLDFEKNRAIEYRSDEQRWKLRKAIVEELFYQPIPSSEENLKLKDAGARPLTKVKFEKKVFLLIGPPASGKSGIANKIANEYGAIILDSDFAKWKLPEFELNAAGASLVHTESSGIIWGIGISDNFVPLVGRCTDEGINIVAPRIGHDVNDILKMATTFKNDFGYEVHLTLVSLDRQKATKRALDRFADKSNGRYVPLSLIFDVYGNDPILSYYRLKESHKTLFASIGKISTDVARGNPYIVIYSENGNPSELFSN